jgi:hypothetical protein
MDVAIPKLRAGALAGRASAVTRTSAADDNLRSRGCR